MDWRPDAPFNELPPLPPEGVDLEPKAVLKATVEARAALATLAQAGEMLPNPTVLVHTVPLLEAQASSAIENIVTTADELFKHADSGGGDPATKEALRYRRALFAGVESIRSRPLSASTSARICSELQGRDVSVRAMPGTRIINPATHSVVYPPSEGADLLRDPILYLSRAIIARKDDYYRLLRAVTAEGAWIEWILHMLDVVRESAASTTRKITAIRTCQDEIADRARAASPGGRDARLLEVLFEQPYCRISTVVDRCAVARQTASSWLHALVAVGLFAHVKAGREILFVNHRFLDVLTRPGMNGELL